jgi:hypothetical protein
VKCRVKIVPRGGPPNANGKWITWNLSRRKGSVWQQGPRGYYIVAYVQPYRSNPRRQKRPAGNWWRHMNEIKRDKEKFQ